jgi:hypothetical protein
LQAGELGEIDAQRRCCNAAAVRKRDCFERARIGIKPATASPNTDYYPLEQLQLVRFNGERYENLGPVIDGGISKA